MGRRSPCRVSRVACRVSRVGSRGSGSFAVAVPDDAVAGLTTLRAIATTTDSRAEVSFTVAGCTLSPTNGYAGSVVAVSCAGFQPGETVDLLWGRTGTTPSASFVAVPGGTGAASFKLPAAIGGTHDVIARGRTSGRTATIPITVKPYLRLTPASGPAGTSIDARLYGFRPGESVCVTWQVTTTPPPLHAPWSPTRAAAPPGSGLPSRWTHRPAATASSAGAASEAWRSARSP